MARTRYLKPGFFLNEKLADIDYPARLLFSSLWLQADREGRLEDNPKRLRAVTFPYDPCTVEDVDQWLSDLAGETDNPDTQFIIRYTVNKRRYIQIVNFSKHQTPHMRELKSSIPPPDPALTPEPSPVTPDDDDSEPDLESPAQDKPESGMSPAQDKPESGRTSMGNDIWGMGNENENENENGNGNENERGTNAQPRELARTPVQPISLKTISPPDDSPVGIWQDVFDRLLPIAQVDVLEYEKVSELGIWREACTAWRANDYSYKNISGLIESYKRRLKIHNEQRQKANVIPMQVNQTPGICNTCWGQETIVNFVVRDDRRVPNGRIPCPKCAAKTKTA